MRICVITSYYCKVVVVLEAQFCTLLEVWRGWELGCWRLTRRLCTPRIGASKYRAWQNCGDSILWSQMANKTNNNVGINTWLLQPITHSRCRTVFRETYRAAANDFFCPEPGRSSSVTKCLKVNTGTKNKDAATVMQQQWCRQWCVKKRKRW